MSCCGNRGGGSAQRCTCKVIAGDGATVTGTGASKDPYVVSAKGGGGAEVDCEQVRGCITAEGPATYDPKTGKIGVKLSGDDDNQARTGDDGGLYVPKTSGSAGTPVVGCGLQGTGSTGDPLRVAARKWDDSQCAPKDSGSPVYCTTDGVLYVDNGVKTLYSTTTSNETFEAKPVPEGAEDLGHASIKLTNPDKCREARVIVSVELDIDVDLPANGGSANTRLGGEEMWSMTNGSSEVITNQHAQMVKNFYNYVIKPGETLDFKAPWGLGGGVKGATYNRVQWRVRALLLIGTTNERDAEGKKVED